MSKSATVQVEVSADCTDLQQLDATTMRYVFEEASALDLLEFVIRAFSLSDEYYFVIKCKTVDFMGQPKVATLNQFSYVTEGQLYYLFISPSDHDHGNHCQLVPRSRAAPSTVDTALSQPPPSPSRSFSMLSVADTPRRQRVPFSEESSNHSSRETNEIVEAATPSTSNAVESVVDESAPTRGPPEMLPHPLHPPDRTNKSHFLGELYRKNKHFMDEKFASIQSREAFFFHNINVSERIAFPRNIASFVIMKHISLADYNIRVGALARGNAQKLITDIVMEVTRTEKVSKDDALPLVNFLNDATKTDCFSALLRPKGPLFEAVRKRSSREDESKGFVPRKKNKQMFTEEQFDDVEKAANAAATAHTQEEVEAILKASSPVRCLWIATLVQKDTKLIPETVVAKFPMFKTDGTWLKHDFKYTMEKIYNMPVFNVSEVLQRYAPAIGAVAVDREVLVPADLGMVENDLLRTAEVLMDLIGFYLKRRNVVTADRLILKSQELPSVDEMIAQRRAIKQIAPVIFVISGVHGNEYFVSTDDFALKVPGNFGDALQCLAALHYVLYIEYAKELLNFNLFLENLCGLQTKKMNQTRQALLFDLECKMRNLSQQNESDNV